MMQEFRILPKSKSKIVWQDAMIGDLANQLEIPNDLTFSRDYVTEADREYDNVGYVLEDATTSSLTDDSIGATVSVSPDEETRTTITPGQWITSTTLGSGTGGNLYISNEVSETGSDKVLPIAAKPLYDDIGVYRTTIAANGDPADIYFPLVPNSGNKTLEFPIALMLQGALVNKADYENFATQVASYGFVVVVPNHVRTLANPGGQSFTGFFPEQQQVNDVLAQLHIEDADPTSPIMEIIDTEKLGLLGHSFGGAVGLASVQNIAVPGLSTGSYTRPPELMAGIFYGTNFSLPPTGTISPIDNDGIPTGLIIGTRDGVTNPAVSRQTYDQILNPPKAFITVEGANHYSITDEDNLIREPNRPTLEQSIATETIARWSALFLQAHLLGNQKAFNYVYRFGDVLDPNVSVISQTEPAWAQAA